MMYTRSDVLSVNVSAEGHGGCGQPHVRETDASGAPVQPWGISCQACEGYLRTDSHWSLTVDEIPATHDEAKQLERWKVQGAREQDVLMTSLLAQLAGYSPAQLPQSVQRAIGGIGPHIPLPGQMVCPSCSSHQQGGQPFCGQCGTRMSAPVPAAAVTSGDAA